MGWKCSPGSTTRRGRPFPRRTFGGAKSGSHGRHDRLLKQPSNWRPGTAPACPIVYLTEGYRPRCATKINQADNRHRRALRALGSLGAYELFPTPLGGDTSAFSECREFRPDNVRIDGGLSDPSSVSAIAAGNYVLPSNQFRVIADAIGNQLRVLDKIRFGYR